MAPLTPNQRRNRDRAEGVIRLMAPFLDVMLTVGDRVSRLVEPDDPEYYPPRTTNAEPPPPPSSDSGGRSAGAG